MIKAAAGVFDENANANPIDASIKYINSFFPDFFESYPFHKNKSPKIEKVKTIIFSCNHLLLCKI